MRRAALLGLGLFVSLAGSAQAAQRLIAIDTPSANVNPADVRFNGGATHPHVLRANVLLPDGYDGRRRFPVLFLLHGVGDEFRTWARPDKGDVQAIAKGLPAIVVMPEAARGFYTNWWNGGLRAKPGWERFYIDELVSLVERRFRVLPGRRNHAAAGVSMGGFGAVWLASQLPSYFGSAATFSGFVQHQRPEIDPALRVVGEVEYEQIFGPMDGFYATGHNPTRLAANLRHTRVFVTVGDGRAEPGVPGEPASITGGGAVEAGLRLQAEEFVAALKAAGVPVLYSPRGGVHDWPYNRRALRDAIAWGLFRTVVESPRTWTYRTVAPRGDAWGLAYRFTPPPESVITFTRSGNRLRGAGGTGGVRIENKAHCAISPTLPFDRALPPPICGRISVKVRPRRLRVGRRATLRFRVRRVVGSRRFPLAGARIRFAGRRVNTNARGVARMRIRPRRLGRRRARVGIRGLTTVRPRLRVVP